MPRFSEKSLAKLETCCIGLQSVFNEVIRHFDCTVIEGHRTLERQGELLKEGKTQVTISNHNATPSKAVDVAPYPINWDDRERFTYFAGFVMGIAKAMGVSLRWGGDWDRDTEVSNNKFDDLVHYEEV